MLVINTRTDQYYQNVSKSEAARIIGVDRATIYRWTSKNLMGNSNKEVYNNFIIYFGEPSQPPNATPD